MENRGKCWGFCTNPRLLPLTPAIGRGLFFGCDVCIMVKAANGILTKDGSTMVSIEVIRGTSQCYLIHGAEGCVLVDTGATPQRDRLLSRVRDLPLRLIVLTHGHYDHIANASCLRLETGAPIAMHPADQPLIADRNARPLHKRKPLGSLIMWAGNRMDRPDAARMFTPDLDVSDGMSLRPYGVEAVMRELPGHTKGSVGVLVDGADFIVGDAMMHLFVDTRPKMAEDWEQARQSIARIHASGARTAYVGHGRPVRL